jgi:ankyrin repeat protein
MFLKYVFILAFTLITASWASSIDGGEETAVSFSEIAGLLIKDALDKPEIASQISSSSRAILSSISSQNECTMDFYNFAIQKYGMNEFGFDPEDPQYWNFFIASTFHDFSSDHADQTQVIINEIVLPSHPFLSQVPCTIETADFLGNKFIFDIDVYLDHIAYNIFVQNFTQILTLEDSEAQILLKALFYKVKNTSFHDPDFKYHHAFLQNVPVHYFKRTTQYHFKHHKNINSFIIRLASTLYYEIDNADEILSGLLPSIYSELSDKSYENVIRKYQESLLEPIDKYYLWDPQQFNSNLLSALQALRDVENSNLSPYVKILGFISTDSTLAQLYRGYIVKNYVEPSNLSAQDQPIFWRSLILSSFSAFSTVFPHNSRQIIEQLHLLPNMGDIQSISVYDILDDQFFCKAHFPLVSGWGHTITVDLFLKNIIDINNVDEDEDEEHLVSSAFLNAASGGHTSTIDFLLRNNDFFVGDLGWAIENAAEGGHTSTVDFFLQLNDDIEYTYVSIALIKAVQDGHTSTVDLLLRSRDDIDSNYIFDSFDFAIENDNVDIVDLFLQHCTEFDADEAGHYLHNASVNGQTLIVDVLLQRRTDISVVDIVGALCSAATVGKTSSIDILLQRRTDIAASDLDKALEHAAKRGHTHTVDFLLQRLTDADASSAIKALRYAAEAGHFSTVDFLLQRHIDIPATDVSWALHNAAGVGKSSIVDLLLQLRVDMTASEVGWALQNAAAGGHTHTVDIILQRRADIPAIDLNMALKYAAKGGHTQTFHLLKSRSNIAVDGNDSDSNCGPNEESRKRGRFESDDSDAPNSKKGRN